jgi:hypothetical protein
MGSNMDVEGERGIQGWLDPNLYELDLGLD